jgi:methionyl-tRNA formyltransferase
LAYVGGVDLEDTIVNLEEKQANAWSQDESKVSKAPKIHLKQGHINWENDDVFSVYAKFRAFGKHAPIHSYLNGKKVKLMEIPDPKSYPKLNSAPDDAVPGQIGYSKHNKTIYIKCTDEWLPVTLLTVDGKRPTIARDFQNGYLCVDKKSSKRTHFFDYYKD